MPLQPYASTPRRRKRRTDLTASLEALPPGALTRECMLLRQAQELTWYRDRRDQALAVAAYLDDHIAELEAVLRRAAAAARQDQPRTTPALRLVQGGRVK